MSSSPQRQALLLLINEACTAGARLQRACRQIGQTERTLQRWQRPEAEDGDHRGLTSVLRRHRPTNSVRRSVTMRWHCSTATPSKTCRPVRSCLAWPIKVST